MGWPTDIFATNPVLCHTGHKKRSLSLPTTRNSPCQNEGCTTRDFGAMKESGTREEQLGSTPSTADTPQQMHGPDRCCSRPTSIFRSRMSPEGMVQRHLVDRELLKVRALFSVGMPTLFLGAAPKDVCAVCFWYVVVYRSNDSMSTRSWWLWSS